MFFGILSVTIVSADWRAVFDLEIPFWLLLETKYQVFPDCFSLGYEKSDF